MSLTKLFNFKYLKQNAKITKGQLFLFLCIIPVFTFLILLLATNSYYIDVKSILDISIINILGMFVIPLILSISLFAYVYKKESVDFINSMPIKRKTIFLTNTLIGIVLIIIMQLINMAGLLILSETNTDMVIFKEMIIDVFIMMTISYIFVFTVTNIAMSLSGNILTQIVVTMLILFLVPFSVGMINRSFYSSYLDYDILENNELVGIIEAKNNSEETMPFRIIRLSITNELDDIYSLKSIYKMVFLSIVYIIVGVYFFERRKFENSHESFANQKIHLIVKTLTIFPMIMVLSAFHYLEYSIELIIFCLALVIVYYFLYDLVTSKKIKFRTSVIYLVVMLLFLNGLCFKITEITENNQFRKINKEDIVGISINVSKNYKRGFENSKVLDYYIEDKELIELIYNLNIDRERNSITYYDSSFSYSPIRIKLKDGRIINTSLNTYNATKLRKETKEKIIQKLANDEKYMKIYKDQFKENGKLIIDNLNTLEKNNELCKMIDKYIDTCSLEQLMSLTGNELNRYSYINHHIISYFIDPDVTDELFKTVVELCNNNAKEILKDSEIRYINIELVKENIYIVSRYADSVKYNEEIKEIILKENSNPIDFKKEYYLLRVTYVDGDGNHKNVLFYTNNSRIKEIYNEIEIEKDIEIYNNEEYDDYDDYTDTENDYTVVSENEIR